jgi:4-amino-4-deoxy-L-arabinose transferase-like glycosyltransferase
VQGKKQRMQSSEEFVQRAVHALEAGALAVWIRRALVAIAIAAIAVLYLYHFRGLATSQAMDQAQIGRAIATGHGWRTNFVRPRAIGQLIAHHKNVPQKIWRDTYNAPLPPLVDAIALWPVRGHLKLTPRDLVGTGDKVIAIMSMLLFALSVVVLFFTAQRLFDRRLALLACGLVVLCDSMWQYSLSGLPQMLLLLLFNATVYALVRAVETRNAGKPTSTWLAAVGAGFGFLALTHALTLWIFLGAFVFIVFLFQPRIRTAVIVLGVFAILYLPWLLRNYIVCGNPGGVAIYTVLDGLGHSEAGWMRGLGLNLAGIGPAAVGDKMVTNLIAQFGRIFHYFGWSVVAVMFFPALLYSFKRPETAVMRWMILAMWGGAVLGMVVYGINEEQGFASNQLHLIFVPLMTCYGLAYLLVQWSRLGINIRLARMAFITLLYLLCALPMIFAPPFLGPAKPRIYWPPYMPPYIAILNDWMKPDEITASDMPWAIAWYADRRSIWLPETVKNFTDLSDYQVLGAPINGVYLTPVSGTENKLGDIVRGDYHEWMALILRTQGLDKFPLKWSTVELGLENECLFLSDHDRRSSARP